MNDRREAVLSRLVDLFGSIQGISTVLRNADKVSDRQRPAIVIHDSDEHTFEDTPQGSRRGAPDIVGMTPEVYITLGDAGGSVGADLNALRLKVLAAVLGDDGLAGIIGSNGHIRYDGCVTSLARGRTMEAEMGLSFTFRYPLILTELS